MPAVDAPPESVAAPVLAVPSSSHSSSAVSVIVSAPSGATSASTTPPTPACVAGGLRRPYAAHERLATVAVGTSTDALRARFGAPTSCAGGDWVYFAGTSDGPAAIFTFVVRGGRVTAVQRSGYGCKIDL